MERMDRCQRIEDCTARGSPAAFRLEQPTQDLHARRIEFDCPPLASGFCVAAELRGIA